MSDASALPRVRLIGLPTDSHSSFLRGAADGPRAIRAALESEHANTSAENGLEIGADVLVEDGGDLDLRERESDLAIIRQGIIDAVAAGAVPISLGGDHMVTFPVVAALAEAHGPLNILHFDAHPDLYDEYPVTTAPGCLHRILVEMRDFAPDRVPVPAPPLYISIDLDGFDPAFAPGVAHHEPGGPSVREFLQVLRRVPGGIVGADIVELNPARDLGGITATLAAKLVRELASLTRKDAS